MDAATLQQRIYGGYAKAALRTGSAFTVYRPSGTSAAADPLVPGNIVTTLPASFNAEDMRYARPNVYGRATWYCLTDGTQVEAGDYLVNGGGIFFLAALQPLLPILAVQCNRAVRIGRMPPANGAGFVGYAGVVESQQQDALGSAGPGGAFGSGWPASILMAGKSDSDAVLPSSVKQGGVTILLPPSVPLTIVQSDLLQDDLGREFTITSAESTDLGWRIQATEEHA
jgi:hypothetical protein